MFGFSVAVLVTATAHAQDTKPAAPANDAGVHRLEIFNGPSRSVHFFSASPGERAGFESVAYAEKQAELAYQLLDLRNQYVHDERILQNHRRSVQQQWYGAANEYSLGWGTSYPAYPVGYAGFVYPGFGLGGMGGSSISHNLAYGVGDEGMLKADISRTLATQATPEFAADASQALDNARARLAGPTPRPAPGVRTAGYEPPPADTSRLATPGAHVIVTHKVGDKPEKTEGTLIRESPDWLVLQTATGTRTFSKRAITEVLEPPQEKK